MLSTKSSKSKAETKKPKISTRSRTLKTVQSTANIGSDRAKSLEITKADRNGLTINNKTLTLSTKSVDKEDKPAKKEVATNGHSNGHNNGHTDKREKELKEKMREEAEEAEDRMQEDERDEDEVLTELMSAQRPREDKDRTNHAHEDSEGEHEDHWYAPTQPYRSDDSDDERRRSKAKSAQARRSPVPKQTQYDNEDEIKLGSSVEIIPVGKHVSHKMSVNSHSVSLQDKKPETRPLPTMAASTNTNRQLLSTSTNRRRSDETGETASHHGNSESLFDDSDKTNVLSSHSPNASNGKTNRAPGTPLHLVSVRHSI